MQVLIGGVIAAVLGFIGLIAWGSEFLTILKGGIPIILLLGGALAIYVGVDEMKDQMQEKKDLQKDQQQKQEELDKAKAELEKAKAEADKLKSEIKKSKKKE
ncbi:MAG: 5-bromo-4-chloroindolyl phosphate hydrolysis family protein [Deltaproteobacteria bacterium]|jgi:uncharacterized protein (DUF3084 family)|nr:5-bromo-4-chloroindolyl phosphate hydrolysis family protein [Deltaproteobacteria bacterium]MBN2846377.1 5-bromo-4-chloroindolyl phosphate hydrolysis family protein [Deltaproteobacteria bacterium]MBW2636038.1 5-bromo-4-chloroindolyl phosphate hydrolysis family protein [Deltaproteobacteria bacterium]